MTAVETHWSIAIETDVPGQLTVRCGCGWSEIIPGAGGRHINRARYQWENHPCPGRPITQGEPAMTDSHDIDRDDAWRRAIQLHADHPHLDGRTILTALDDEFAGSDFFPSATADFARRVETMVGAG